MLVKFFTSPIGHIYQMNMKHIYYELYIYNQIWYNRVTDKKVREIIHLLLQYKNGLTIKLNHIKYFDLQTICNSYTQREKFN